MRLVKLSTEVFKSEEAIHYYFQDKDSEFRTRGDNGVFLFPKGWISKNSIHLNDRILFSYRNHIMYVARACSGCLPWLGKDWKKYPNCLEIDLDSIREVSFSVAELESELRRETELNKSIEKSQGWPLLSDDSKTEAIVDRLCG